MRASFGPSFWRWFVLLSVVALFFAARLWPALREALEQVCSYFPR